MELCIADTFAAEGTVVRLIIGYAATRSGGEGKGTIGG